MAAIAKEEKVVVIASLFERGRQGFITIRRQFSRRTDRWRGSTEDAHPDDPLYYEKFYFTPGDLGFKAMKTSQGHIGTLVCWDQWYPEGARVTALQGANTLFFPTAIGWHPSEKEEFGEAQYSAWQTIQRSHAIANGVFVGAVESRRVRAWRCSA